MAEGLKIIIGADIKEAQAALKTIAADTAVAGKQIDKSFSKASLPLTKGITEVSASVKKLTPQISTLGNNIETLRAKLLARQNFLINETDVNKIAVYNKEIKLLESEIIRLKNIGKDGFDSIGNAIVKSSGGVDNFAAGAGKAFSVLRQVAFILPGIGIAGLLGGLSELVIGLFKTTQGFSDADFAASRFNASINRLKDDLQGLKFAIDFGVDLAKLRAQLAGKSPAAVDVLGLGGTIKGNRELQNQITDQLDELNKTILQRTNFANQVLSAQGKKLLSTIKGDVNAELDKGLVDKLKSGDQKILNELAGFQTKRKVLLDAQSKLSEESAKGLIEIQIKQKDEEARILKERLANLAKIRSTIGGDAAAEAITVPIIVSPDLVAVGRNEMAEIEAKVQKSISGGDGVEIPARITIDDADSRNAFQGITKQAEKLGQIINGLLTPAFDGLFEAIKSGENPLKAFFEGLGQAVLQLIQKLIQAAITAAILSAILPGGGGGFGALFGKFLGLAGGGLVSGPTLAAVGEGSGTSLSNPEVVAPLDQLKAMLGDIGSGGAQVVVMRTEISGTKLSLVQARTSRRNKRLGATG